MSLHIGETQTFESFRNDLNILVGHLGDSSQLDTTLAMKVSQLVMHFLEGNCHQNISSMNMFEINIIESSVHMHQLPVKVTSLMNAKSVNRQFLADVWGEVLNEKDLYATLYLDVLKS